MTLRRHLKVLLILLLPVAVLLAAMSPAQADEVLAPEQIAPSELSLRVEHVGTMPFVLGPGFVPTVMQPNLASPVSFRKRLYLIDQNDAIYRVKDRRGEGQVEKIFDVASAPDGLALDNRLSVLNISEGRNKNQMYVMLTSGTEPTTAIPIYRLPDPLPDDCCDLAAPIPLDDLYRIGDIPGPVSFFGSTRTEYQVLYEYQISGASLTAPRAIAAFETQSGPTHNGGGMLTLKDGRVLFATGDALPFGADGRAAAQDPSSHLSKVVIIDPDDGSIEIAAQGLRNVQQMQYVNGRLVGFGDIGGITAEEVNYVSLKALLDTSTIENFGWGRNADGIAREGMFYIEPGVAMGGGSEPPVAARAPSPEQGFIQPHAQYGRNDPFGGVAVSGPISSPRSFKRIKNLFSDLDSGLLYATTASKTDVDVPVLLVNLVDENGTSLGSLEDLAGGRADPRLFLFPDGTSGVLLEATGDYYRLTEVRHR